MEKSVKKIFLNCQLSLATHAKLVKKLIEIYVKSDFDEFVAYFLHLLKYSLIHGDKQPAIEKTLAFVATFATSVKSETDAKDEPEITNSEDVDNMEGDIDPFLVTLFEFLLNNHEANSQSVRYRVCQLINQLLNSMGEKASIDDDLYSTIYDTMLQRLMDKVPSVRVQAILALARLQDPRNKECPVIKAYLFHLSMDPNPEVRKAVLNNIAITFQTLPDIIDRIRDVRDAVRRQAYSILAQKVHIRSFTIAQRVLLISEGLNDRNESVCNVVKKNLIQAWLRLVDGNVIELLKSLDVETSIESAEKVLKCLYEDVGYRVLLNNFNLTNRSKVIDIENLKPESVFYWKSLSNHLRSEKADEFLEEILPDLSAFCLYVKDYVNLEAPDEVDPQDTAMKLMEKDFICQQLISMTSLFDLSDEVGRQSLHNMLRTMLLNSNLGDNCIKELCKIFSLVHPPISRINQLAEIISDLREPEPATPLVTETPVAQQLPTAPISQDEQRKQKIMIAKVRVKINQVKDELEDCVRSLNLERAQELKLDLQDLEEELSVLSKQASRTPQSTPAFCATSPAKIPEDEEEQKQLDDPQTLSRCLFIVGEFMESSDITTLNSMLRSLHDNLILPCMKSEDLAVRKFAVKALLLICLVSKELAKQHMVLIVQISQMDVVEIQMIALKGIFDLLQLFGIEEFSDAAGDIEDLPSMEESGTFDSQEPHVASMISLLSKMLESDCSEIRTIVAEGLCKLMLASRISSSKLLSHLIILWYNPLTEDDQLLRHVLGVFFPLYASMGSSNQESICSAVLPTLRTIFNAPHHSPLSDIDRSDVANFLVSITGPSIVSNQAKITVNVHDTLVFSLCSEIIAYPDNDHVRILVSCLNRITLTPTNISALKQIDVLCLKMLKKLRDKAVLTNVEKFHRKVKEFLSKALTQEEDLNLTDQSQTNKTIDADKDQTCNSSQMSMLDKSARRKRALYSAVKNIELYSDSDAETLNTIKKTREETQPIEDDTTLVSVDSEVEIRSQISDFQTKLREVKVMVTRLDDNYSSDLFASSDSNAKNKESNVVVIESDTESDTEYDTIGKRQIEIRTSTDNESTTPVRKSSRYDSDSKNTSSSPFVSANEDCPSSSNSSVAVQPKKKKQKKSSSPSLVVAPMVRRSSTRNVTPSGRLLRGNSSTPQSSSQSPILSSRSRSGSSKTSSLKSSDNCSSETLAASTSKSQKKIKRKVSLSSIDSDSSQERVSRLSTKRTARKNRK